MDRGDMEVEEWMDGKEGTDGPDIFTHSAEPGNCLQLQFVRSLLMRRRWPNHGIRDKNWISPSWNTGLMPRRSARANTDTEDKTMFATSKTTCWISFGVTLPDAKYRFQNRNGTRPCGCEQRPGSIRRRWQNSVSG